MKIIPTILEKDFNEAERRLSQLIGKVAWVQVDVIDGFFTSGKTFELELLSRSEWDTDRLLLDIHLMVKKPEKWLEKSLFAGAARVIGQVEMMTDRAGFIRTAKNMGLEAGIAFDIDTKIDDIPEDTDEVLLMARKAGFEPAGMSNEIWERIKIIKGIRAKTGQNFIIAIDGGVTEENIRALEEAGVDVAYSGHRFEAIEKIYAGKDKKNN